MLENRKINEGAFWVIVGSLVLICIVPFNYMPYARVHLFDRNIPLNHIFFSATGLFFILVSIYNIIQFRTIPTFVWLCLLVFGSMLASSTLAISNKGEGIQTSMGFLFRSIGPSLVAYFLVRFQNKEHVLRETLFFLAFLISLGVVYEYFTGRYFLFVRQSYQPLSNMELWSPELGYAVGAIGQPLPLAVLLNLYLPFVVGFWKNTKRSLYFIVNVAVVAVLFLTFRRSAIPLMVLTFILTVYFSGWPKLKIYLIGAAFFFASAVVLIAIPRTRAKVMDRFSIKNTIYEMKNLHRRKAYRTSVQMFLDKPWFGIGTRQYAEQYYNYAEYQNPASSPDNQYLRLLAEGGIVGFVTFLILIGYIFTRAWIHLQTFEGVQYLSAISVFTLAMIINDSLYWPAIQMTAFVVIGMSMGHIDAKFDVKVTTR
jgi:O-antigen ligase